MAIALKTGFRLRVRPDFDNLPVGDITGSMRYWSSGWAPAFQAGDAGSIPAYRSLPDSPSGRWRLSCKQETKVRVSSNLTSGSVGESSNGRTKVFGAFYLGSNPSSPANTLWCNRKHA